MDDVYRTIPRPTPEDRSTRDTKRRAAWILAISLAAHAGILACAFAMRSPAPKETTQVVRVLAGHVDAETGAFEASGVRDARIRK